jgi:hypothetical protein
MTSAITLPFYSPEAIAFQDTSFFETITGIVAKARTTPGAMTTKQMLEFEEDLTKAIKKRTGMNIKVRVDAWYDFSILLPEFDKNSPLMKDYFPQSVLSSRDTLSAINRNAKKYERGLVDLEGARVSGFFAELPDTVLYVPEYRMNQVTKHALANDEIAALILHEIGHHFNYFDFVVRFRTTNQTLAAAVRELDGTTDFAQREIIVKEAASLLDVVSETDTKELSDKKTQTITTVLISNMARKVKSQNGLGGYDATTCEAQADVFVQRFGAGRQLVTALNKTGTESGMISNRSTTMYVIGEFVKFVRTAIGITFLAIGGLVGNLFLVFIGCINVFVGLFLIMADSYDGRYDKNGARFKRIRDQLVSRLKMPNIPERLSESIQTDIRAIDQVRESTKDHVQVVGLVYDYIIPSGISARKSIAFQQALEDFSNNNLFVYADRLKWA